jgi:hypothetical protein
MGHEKKSQTFLSAEEGARSARLCSESLQTLSAAYRLAYTDRDFLLRHELRPVRLQLELLKPELILNEHLTHVGERQKRAVPSGPLHGRGHAG